MRAAELIDGMALIYAQNFTAAELRITAFLSLFAPTGQKLLEKLPGHRATRHVYQ